MENEQAGQEREEKALAAQRISGPLRHGVARLILGCWLAVVASAAMVFGAGAQQEQTAPAAGLARTDTASGASVQADDLDIQEIIRRFAAKEKEFQTARENYTYRQIVKVQELSPDGEVRGTYHMEEDIMFTQDGKRFEKVVYAPLSTLRAISISPEDERDLRSVQPFVLTTDDLHKYDVKYMGRQNVDELSTYVFMVSPKRMEKGERYFQGQIWVDDRDLQIVKTYGKAVPDIRKKGQENLFPRFETYREQIDGKYWFPTWTGADDTLHFSSGPQRIRMIVRYEDYKQFRSTIKVTYGDEVPPEESQPEPSVPQQPE